MFHYLSSFFVLYFFFLLGSRVTVFWDHMTISQFCPLPLPMCSSPHGVASPAQFRPALRMPSALPRPSRRTTPPPPSQVYYGLKVHQSQETEQQHVHMGEQGWNLSSTRDQREVETCPSALSALFVLQHGLQRGLSFRCSRTNERSAKARAFEAILCPICLSCFPQGLKVTPKTVGWWLDRNKSQWSWGVFF